jgi:hypothetical protein
MRLHLDHMACKCVPSFEIGWKSFKLILINWCILGSFIQRLRCVVEGSLVSLLEFRVRVFGAIVLEWLISSLLSNSVGLPFTRWGR